MEKTGNPDRDKQEDAETLEVSEFFKSLKQGIKDNLRWEHIIILLLIASVIFCIGYMERISNSCNTYWIKQIENCYRTYDPTFQLGNEYIMNVSPRGHYEIPDS
jgi:hypothetical protein